MKSSSCRVTVVIGHYGSGKTNFSLNLALEESRRGRRVALVDLDVVNPYFRAGDYASLLHRQGIEVVTSGLHDTTVDLPALTARAVGVLSEDFDHVIFDVGGDDAGSYALGRFSHTISAADDLRVLYIVNGYRPLTKTPEQAVALLREMEGTGRMPATAIVNNSHLGEWTTEKTILEKVPFGEEVSQLTGLPLFYTTAPQSLAEGLERDIPNLYPVEILVKPPFSFEEVT